MLRILEFKKKFNSVKLFFPCFFFQIAICHSFEKKNTHPNTTNPNLAEFWLVGFIDFNSVGSTYRQVPEAQLRFRETNSNEKKKQKIQCLYSAIRQLVQFPLDVSHCLLRIKYPSDVIFIEANRQHRNRFCTSSWACAWDSAPESQEADDFETSKISQWKKNAVCTGCTCFQCHFHLLICLPGEQGDL